MPATTDEQRRLIEIVVKATGERQLKRLVNRFDSLDRNVKQTSNTLNQARRVFGAFAAGIGIREITRAVDEFQLLKDRIAVFAQEGEDANEVFKQLGETAIATRTSTAGLATTYNRIAVATSELGLSSAELLGVTEALQNTFRLSGATIAEAAAVSIQLSQGLSSGALRGQELRSVLEQNAELAGLLAKELGSTRGQLIKLAETGAITSDVVFSALSKNFDALRDRAGKLRITFEQGLTIAIDAVRRKFLELNESLGVSESFGRVAESFARNIDKITDAFLALAGSLAVLGIAGKIGAITKGLGGS